MYTPHICDASILELRKNLFSSTSKCSAPTLGEDKNMLGFIRINAPSSWKYFSQKFVIKRDMGYAKIYKILIQKKSKINK